MKKIIPPKVIPEQKLVRRFAWLPKRLEHKNIEYRVWLEFYWQMLQYQDTVYGQGYRIFHEWPDFDTPYKRKA